MYGISEETMDFTLNFYMRLSWNDPKLAFGRAGRRLITLEPRDVTGENHHPERERGVWPGLVQPQTAVFIPRSESANSTIQYRNWQNQLIFVSLVVWCPLDHS